MRGRRSDLRRKEEEMDACLGQVASTRMRAEPTINWERPASATKVVHCVDLGPRYRRL